MTTSAQLRTKFRLEQLDRSEAIQDSSEQRARWVFVRHLRGELKPSGGGNEVFSQTQIKSIQLWIFRTRYSRSITPGMRLVEVPTGDVFNIEVVKEDRQRKGWLVIRCARWQSSHI